MRRGEIEHRIDCQFHLPEHYELIDRIGKSGFPVHRIGDKEISQNVVDGPFGSQLKVEEYVESGVPLVRVSNCRTGEVLDDSELVFISEEKHHQLIRSEVLPGDVLVTKAGHILGYAAVFPERLVKGNITSHLAAIRLSPGVVSEYLAAYIRSSLGLGQIYRWGSKATRPELNTDEVRELLVPLPPEDVQQALAQDLESARIKFGEKSAAADALLAGLDSFLLEQLGLTLPQEETRLAYGVTLKDVNADRFDPHFYNPRFHNLVESIQSRPHDKLGDIVQFSNQQWNPNESDSEYFTYIEISGIALSSGVVTPSEVPVSEAPSRARMFVRTGDIIISLTRPHRGAIALIGSDLDGCVASTGFAVIHRVIRDDITRDYLWSVLRSQLCLQQMLQRSSGGNYPAITQPELAKISIPTPSISVQREIVAKVRNCHEEARSLRTEAAQEWEAARVRFEARLLGEDR